MVGEKGKVGGWAARLGRLLQAQASDAAKARWQQLQKLAAGLQPAPGAHLPLSASRPPTMEAPASSSSMRLQQEGT